VVDETMRDLGRIALAALWVNRGVHSPTDDLS
jgi:hypothetical protein